jgi:hypothetical protein
LRIWYKACCRFRNPHNMAAWFFRPKKLKMTFKTQAAAAAKAIAWWLIPFMIPKRGRKNHSGRKRAREFRGAGGRQPPKKTARAGEKTAGGRAGGGLPRAGGRFWGGWGGPRDFLSPGPQIERRFGPRGKSRSFNRQKRPQKRCTFRARERPLLPVKLFMFFL